MPGLGSDGARGGIEYCRVLVNEEAAISPTFAIFFRGCDCRCRFCVSTGLSGCGKQRVAPGTLRRLLEATPDLGVKTVSFVGGEPSLYALEIAAAARGLPLPPLVLNSNMLYSNRTWSIIGGLFSVYIADLKFGNDECALRLSGAPQYWKRATRNIVRAARSARVIVRHLVLPGHTLCCTKPVLEWLAAQSLETNLMLNYHPARQASAVEAGLDKPLEDQERRLAMGIARGLGVKTTPMPDPAEWGVAAHSLLPRPGAVPSGPLEIIIDPCGRLVIPDLPVELVDLVHHAAPAPQPPRQPHRPPTRGP